MCGSPSCFRKLLTWLGTHSPGCISSHIMFPECGLPFFLCSPQPSLHVGPLQLAASVLVLGLSAGAVCFYVSQAFSFFLSSTSVLIFCLVCVGGFISVLVSFLFSLRVCTLGVFWFCSQPPSRCIPSKSYRPR